MRVLPWGLVFAGAIALIYLSCITLLELLNAYNAALRMGYPGLRLRLRPGAGDTFELTQDLGRMGLVVGWTGALVGLTKLWASVRRFVPQQAAWIIWGALILIWGAIVWGTRPAADLAGRVEEGATIVASEVARWYFAPMWLWAGIAIIALSAVFIALPLLLPDGPTAVAEPVAAAIDDERRQEEAERRWEREVGNPPRNS